MSEVDDYRQGLADAAVVLRVQALGKLVPANRDGFLSACNSIIDLRESVSDPDYRDYIARMRAQLDGEPQRLTRLGLGVWEPDKVSR